MLRYLSLALLAMTTTAMAQSMCRDISEAKKMATDAGATNWVELTRDQWEFVRTIYVLNKDTPPGLPPGDKAVMASKEDKAAVIFYIDGDKACYPLPIPKDLVELIMQVGTGEIAHVGSGL